MLDTIFFDLDGTLLPMDMDNFMRVYFKELTAKCARYGFEPEPVTRAVWRGTEMMVRNDGSRPNHQAFWEVFIQDMGEGVLPLQAELESFYENEFHRAKTATGENPQAAPLVRRLRAKGYTVALTTNPLFPLSAVRTRLSWIGLEPEDFDHVTTYANCCYAKPNPAYYSEVLQALARRPESCLMVGNDATEDGAARQAGLAVYLVTDGLINSKNVDLAGMETGSFAQCIQKLDALPRLN